MADLPTLEQMNTTADGIKNQTVEGANTATIIGTFFKNIVAFLVDIYEQITGLNSAINDLKSIPLGSHTFNKTGGQITDLSQMYDYRKVTTSDVLFDVLLPDVTKNLGKALIIHNYGDNTFNLKGQTEQIIIDNAEGIAVLKGAVRILMAVSSTQWVLIK